MHRAGYLNDLHYAHLKDSTATGSVAQLTMAGMLAIRTVAVHGLLVLMYQMEMVDEVAVAGERMQKIRFEVA